MASVVPTIRRVCWLTEVNSHGVYLTRPDETGGARSSVGEVLGFQLSGPSKEEVRGSEVPHNS